MFCSQTLTRAEAEEEQAPIVTRHSGAPTTEEFSGETSNRRSQNQVVILEASGPAKMIADSSAPSYASPPDACTNVILTAAYLGRLGLSLTSRFGWHHPTFLTFVFLPATTT